jgi:hypothetical protein
MWLRHAVVDACRLCPFDTDILRPKNSQEILFRVLCFILSYVVENFLKNLILPVSIRVSPGILDHNVIDRPRNRLSPREI